MDPAPSNNADLLRDASEADLPTVCAIYAHHVETGLGTFEEIPPSVVDITQRWRQARQLCLPYLVIERGGAVRGFAYAAPYRTRSAYRYTVEDSVYIDANWLGQGLATLLLQELIVQCGALGYSQMVAVIGGSGNAGSIRLHTGCGFSKVGILRGIGYKFGTPVDSVLMQRTLPAAENSAND